MPDLDGTNVANAHLIAAAPEMYEALKTTLKRFANMREALADHGSAMARLETAFERDLKEILAKAEGRS